MKTLYIECNMGAAGDMLTAALLELVSDPEEMISQLNHLGLPGVTVETEKTQKCGIAGTHMRVRIHGEEEQSLDSHDAHLHEAPAQQHAHAHVEEHIYAADSHHAEHHHHHSTLTDIAHYVDHMPLPEDVKTDIRNVYHLIAEAESHAHNMPVQQIHFHEVGTLDAILDVTAVCLLMHQIHADQVLASPVRTGYGEVRCAHGIMPVPAPATAYLLQGIPSYSGDIEGEMCTPTGAALLRYFVQKFSHQPVLKVQKTGYGMGTKDFPAANCVRAFLGESISFERNTASVKKDEAYSGDDIGKDTGNDQDTILELRANIDDMTGEEIGFASEKLMADGARDVFTTAIGMKKNRPGILLTVICAPEDKEKLVQTIFRYTTTIGIRETVCHRSILRRSESVRTTPYGDIRIKTSTGYGVTRQKAEFEDLKRIADEKGISLSEIRNSVD